MKFKSISILIVIFALTNSSNAKGGRGGFSARGGGSRGGGSKSSGGGWSSWFGGGSKPAPARPSPSYTHSAPSPSHNIPSNTNNAPAYGWNVNRGGSNTQSNSGSNVGWNTGSNSGGTNTGSKPSNTNYGWNVNNNNAQKPSAPVGPPPAYPGMQNRPIPNNNAPPAYSPSHVNPPAYNPGSYNAYSPSINSRPGSNYGGNIPRQNTYNSYSSNTGYNPGYGSTFGSQGLPGNTYISNNYYGSQRSGGSGFLTNAMFFGIGMHSGYGWGRSSDSYNRRRWDEEEDRKWRATTQAPYFENKVPGEDKILPASAVIGAATAFGLVSLLPLNVPANKPLMYCNNTELMQSQIQINNQHIYQCINNTIEMSCSRKVLENQTEVHENQTECVNKKMQCNLKEDEIAGSVYCSNGTLMSKNLIFCNSTTLLNGTNVNETTTILNCYEGQLPESQAAFIPTTTTTQAPITTTEKSLSFGAKVHMFFLRIIGKGDAAEKEITTTTEMPEMTTVKDSWVPEALTIPPETTTLDTTTTEDASFEWMEKMPFKYENGTDGITLKPVNKTLIEMHEKEYNLKSSMGFTENISYPPNWIKVTKSVETTTAASSSLAPDNTSVSADSSTTEQPKSN
ncbi:hypothetical protein ACKWTF_001167 [Chironomus riparius]